MKTKNIATQIWPFRVDYGADMPGTLAKIAGMGFTGVELCRWFDWVDHFDKWSVDEIKTACVNAGLNAISTHIPYYMVAQDRLDELSAFCENLGMKYAMVASLPKTCFASKGDLLGVADIFNLAVESLSSTGIRVGYHCHWEDFKKVDGEVPWEILFDNTVQNFIMQLDTGNALSGGADPVHYLEKYPGRAVLVHLKEFSASGPSEAVGDGDVDWYGVLDVSMKLHHPDWYIIEQEEKDFNPWASAEKSLAFLNTMY